MMIQFAPSNCTVMESDCRKIVMLGKPSMPCDPAPAIVTELILLSIFLTFTFRPVCAAIPAYRVRVMAPPLASTFSVISENPEATVPLEFTETTTAALCGMMAPAADIQSIGETAMIVPPARTLNTWMLTELANGQTAPGAMTFVGQANVRPPVASCAKTKVSSCPGLVPVRVEADTLPVRIRSKPSEAVASKVTDVAYAIDRIDDGKSAEVFTFIMTAVSAERLESEMV